MWKFLALVIVVALLAGLLGAVLGALLFVKSGPQGETGPDGPQGQQGEAGPQGPQGIAGIDGSDSILQVIQNRNDTPVDVESANYSTMQWFNISDLDSSMKIEIDIQQNSRIFAEFSSAHELEPAAQFWMRIVVDNNYNSSRFIYAIGPASSGTYIMTGGMEFLTDPLSAGLHTINVQLWIVESGSSTILNRILDRTLTVIELAS